MTRKIQPIQSTTTTAGGSVSLPVGCRLLRANAEAEGKPTYDFTVAEAVWSPVLGASTSYNTKYCGTRNGTAVNLWKEFPAMTTTANTPTATGHLQITLTFGTGVVGQVFYVQGLINAG